MQSMLIFFVFFYFLWEWVLKEHYNDGIDDEVKDFWGLIYCLASQTAQDCVYGWPVEDQTDFDR